MSSTSPERLTVQSASFRPTRVRRGRLRRGAVAAMVAAALAALATLPAMPAAAEETASPTPTAEGSAPPHTRTSFVLGIKQDIDSLNPFVGLVASAYESYQLMYDYLTGSSQTDFSPVPGLAEKWETSADGKTWTFHLRQGVKWSDGQPLTAKDVVYTFNRVKDGEQENSAYGNYITNLTKVQATDDYTVVFTTSEPSPSMLRMAVPIVPEHVWRNTPSAKVKDFPNTDNPVGSGPFRLVEAKKGQYYRFAANKEYWGGAPKIDELIFRVFANDEAMANALKKGEIDMLNDINSGVFESLQNVPGITASSSKYSGFSEIAYNLGAQTVEGKKIGDGHPALRDKQVRLAIDYAIDRKTLLDKVLHNRGTAETSVIPPIYPSLRYDPGSELRQFDLAKANQILDAAGYAKGADGIRAKDGRKLEFRLFGRESSEESKKAVEYVRDWLGEIGIKVNVQIMSEDNLTETIGQGNFDMFQWGWVVEPDPDFELSVFTCEQRSYEEDGKVAAGWSDSFYCNPEYDKLYAKQKTILDPASRVEVVKQAQKMLYDDVAYSVTWAYDNLEAYRNDRFTGFQRQPSDGGSIVFQYGTYTYRMIEPVAQPKRDDANLGLYLGVGAGAVVLAGLASLMLRNRRRSTTDERE
ncbi:ABC transporter substrate-binding protein [Micromonospora sp. NBC_00898]|uniref:ABC transporter substrate-binding protein n=1 Tax=Micromonospora sp. NBC_00898 TaxID=2975981 RepID=UPI0038663408|nr:ABC transporter substrate-binding protein [Micromonospora sp. NBC_00898]